MDCPAAHPAFAPNRNCLSKSGSFLSLRYSPQPKLVLEMLFIKLAQSKPLVSLDDMIKKLNGLAASGGAVQPVSEAKTVREDAALSPPPTGERSAEPGSDVVSSKDPAEIWQKLRALFSKEYPGLAPNVEKGEIVNLDENVMEIRAAGNSFYTARLRDEKNMAALQEVCDRFFGRKMKIRVVESKKATTKKKQGKESDRERRLRKDALAHPLVTDALDIFKGRVVDVKIL